MTRASLGAGLFVLLGGCAHAPSAPPSAQNCYTEAGWLDSTQGCSAHGGYPDCYLVCPESGTRTRIDSSNSPAAR